MRIALRDCNLGNLAIMKCEALTSCLYAELLSSLLETQWGVLDNNIVIGDPNPHFLAALGG